MSANGRSFWAYDVSVSFLAYEMLVVGREGVPGPWFDQLADSLAAVATVGGSAGLNLEPVVEADAVEPFAALASEAAARLGAFRAVTEADAELRRTGGWPVIWRGLHGPAMPTAPMVDLAHAMIKLLRGTLPEPPPGTWWYLGLPDGPSTITMNGGSDG
ncbi:hypothetical protein ACN263_11035 [Micromonospora sp. WMMD729]|uniref:hypothetical protein n=1 Tax=Micromonospora sp. WMMD729 TaxID=3404127 RepID=UPI003BF53C7B